VVGSQGEVQCVSYWIGRHYPILDVASYDLPDFFYDRNCLDTGNKLKCFLRVREIRVRHTHLSQLC